MSSTTPPGSPGRPGAPVTAWRRWGGPVLCLALLMGLGGAGIERPAAASGPVAGVAAGSGVAVSALPPALGVLLADQVHLRSDAAAGVRVATLDVQWRSWQPTATGTSQAYVSERAATVAAYRRAGFRVAVDLGLQYAPDWVLALPDGQLRDQSGAPSGTANYFFSAEVRRRAETYVTAAVAALGDVWSYRVGLSGRGEALYPEAPAGQWWAYDDLAQGRAAGRAAGTPASPLPGWVPGSARTVSRTQARAWYDWYLGASVSAHAWEVQALRRAGFAGLLQLLLPGTGATPWIYDHRLDDRLADDAADGFHTMNTAAVWWQFLARFPVRHKVAVTVTSVYDRSGAPRGNACAAGDSSLTFAQAAARGWSSTRWLHYLAPRNGFPTVLGESTGDNVPADAGPTVALARACGLQVLSWAWDYQLHDGRHASLADLTEALGSS